VCEARLIDGLSDAEVRALFEQARESDYAALAKEARLLARRLKGAISTERLREATQELTRLKERQAEIAALDFFGAEGRQNVDGFIAGIEARLEQGQPPQPPKQDRTVRQDLDELRGRVWVTRHGVHVDRIACAWLIRRFIDPSARFKFVPPRGYVPERGELRFDMLQAEFMHEGDRCRFGGLVG